MGHIQRAARRLAQRKAELLNLVPLAQRNANGEQRFAGTGVPSRALPFVLEVTGVSGTSPTLNAFVEQSVDGGANYTAVGTFAQKTGGGSETINVPANLKDYMRIRWTIGGTGSPSFTFKVSADLDKAPY